ncbi:MAG TPA: molybdopterin-synthase adenylyltransferase MoeB [Geminicoccaceae bacterium]|nr:molybdopterin-synthase adenylyltransferase MoeB [Geminicoccaceae bacterium]
MEFTDAQLLRYARHIVLPEVGGTGQGRLLESRVLLIGAGGLGSPMLLYLAAAGVGTIGVVDDDRVDLSNLQRQVAHPTGRVGMAKTESAALAAAAVNPEVRIEAHPVRLDAGNAPEIVRGYDVVADGSDSFATRDAVHAACLARGKTLVSASVQGFDGQLTTFKAHLGPPHPCYRCLFPAPPPPGTIPSCATGGVLGALAGVMGCLQATEVLKELLGIGASLSGTLVLYDALDTELRRIRVRRDPDCPLCGGGAAAAATGEDGRG